MTNTNRMKNKLLLFLSIVLFLFTSCKKDEVQLGLLYGTVNEKVTGNAIANVSVELIKSDEKSGESITTDDDGSFEFRNLEEGVYSLHLKKSGYESVTKEGIVVKGGTNSKPVFVQMEKLPPALTIVDDNRNEIDSIDFGIDEGTTMRSFNIFNNSEDELEWSIIYDENKSRWIKAFSKSDGKLKANQTQSVVCTIDRNKLDIGENSAIVHVISNNGSKELKITAKSVEIIETLDVEEVGSHFAVLRGNIVRNIDPEITEYGFVFSTKESPTLNNNAQKISNTSSPPKGKFEMKAEGLEKETTYYVRAFVTNNEKTFYGNQITFCTISHIPKISLINKVYVKSTATTIIDISYRVDDDGGLPIEETGICWDTNPLPTKEKNYIKTGDNKETGKASISGLTPNTAYHIRAYVKNAEEENYSIEEFVITTESGEPSVTIDIDNYNKGKDYLIISGRSYTSDNILIKRQGICYSSANSTPTIYDQYQDAADNNSSLFTCHITGLKGCTTYYCRAYAETEYGETVYSDSKKVLVATTICEPATLKGFVYDQDNNPISGAKVGVGKADGTYNTTYNKNSAITDVNGYYEIPFDVNSVSQWKIVGTKDGYKYETQDVMIVPEQSQQLDFKLLLDKTCDVDLGTGFWADGPSYMLFLCQQSSLSGKTTTRNMRLRNYRSVPVEWSITNVPKEGIELSQYQGTIPADGEISVEWTFTYPTTSATAVALENCGNAYVWNWETIAAGVYVYTYSIVDDSSSPDNQVGIGWKLNYTDCAATCAHSIFLNIGDEQGGFTLAFSQFVTYK